MNAYGRYGVYGGNAEDERAGPGALGPISVIAGAVGAVAQTIGFGLQMKPRGSAIEQRDAYRYAGEARTRRRSSMLQTQTIRQLVTIGALTVGGGIAIVAILGAARAGEKKE